MERGRHSRSLVSLLEPLTAGLQRPFQPAHRCLAACLRLYIACSAVISAHSAGQFLVLLSAAHTPTTPWWAIAQRPVPQQARATAHHERIVVSLDTWWSAALMGGSTLHAGAAAWGGDARVTWRPLRSMRRLARGMVHALRCWWEPEPACACCCAHAANTAATAPCCTAHAGRQAGA